MLLSEESKLKLSEENDISYLGFYPNFYIKMMKFEGLIQQVSSSN